MQTTVEIYEDNSGAVYLARGAEVWGLGPVTPDMRGRAAEDAAGWVDDLWEPNEDDGQTCTDGVDDLDHIATWTRAGLEVHYVFGVLLAGWGGQDYLGVHDDEDC